MGIVGGETVAIHSSEQTIYDDKIYKYCLQLLLSSGIFSPAENEPKIWTNGNQKVQGLHCKLDGVAILFLPVCGFFLVIWPV